MSLKKNHSKILTKYKTHKKSRLRSSQKKSRKHKVHRTTFGARTKVTTRKKFTQRSRSRSPPPVHQNLYENRKGKSRERSRSRSRSRSSSRSRSRSSSRSRSPPPVHQNFYENRVISLPASIRVDGKRYSVEPITNNVYNFIRIKVPPEIKVGDSISGIHPSDGITTISTFIVSKIDAHRKYIILSINQKKLTNKLECFFCSTEDKDNISIVFADTLSGFNTFLIL